MAGFLYILDTCRVNAQTVIVKNQSKNPRSLNSFDFEMTLVLQLVRPFIELRDRCGLQANIQEKIKFALGETAQDDCDSSVLSAYPSQSEKKTPL